jgi:hypothetical protein
MSEEIKAPTLDLTLLDQAERLQTGANVHRIGEAIGLYRSEHMLANWKGWTDIKRARFERYERQLRELVLKIVQEKASAK